MTIDKNTLDRIAQADKELIEKFGADAFDEFDCRPGNSYPEADRDAVIPDGIRREIEERKKALANNQAGADNSVTDN